MQIRRGARVCGNECLGFAWVLYCKVLELGDQTLVDA